MDCPAVCRRSRIRTARAWQCRLVPPAASQADASSIADRPAAMPHIPSLLRLLDDPDQTVVDALLSRLAGDAALLDATWQVAMAVPDIPPALTDLVLRADAEALVDAFAEAEDLEGGAWLLPRLQLPRCDYRRRGAEQLDRLAGRLPAGSDGGRIAAMLCDEFGFGGPRDSLDDPALSFLPDVLRTRVGLPIALTVLWMLIGRRLGSQCQAIALPGQVVGRWEGGFIDLFEYGRALSRDELDVRMQRLGESRTGAYLVPASDRALLRRMARNLVHVYARRQDRVRATIAHGLATA
jgi:hypothetical protein